MKRFQRGFTLIELLIVIAILGVLAAAVLAAINPAEQIARGKDGSRQQSVAQMGHAVLSYYTMQQAYPAAATWNTVLLNAKELKIFPANPTYLLAATQCTNNAAGIPAFCYSVVGGATGTEYVVYTAAESASSRTKANNCATGTPVWIAFYTSQGRGGLVCSTEANLVAATQTLY